MDDAEEEISMEIGDTELRDLLGMFDAPAFARRGMDLEFTLERLHARLRRERERMLEMVRLRLRQWAAAADGSDGWRSYFDRPIDDLWPLAGVPEPPSWSMSAAPPRRRRAVARDLVASIERFNRRWEKLLDALNLEPINTMIEHYNRYYVLEKECVLQSSRLAALHFTPYAPLCISELRAEYSVIPVPRPLG